MNHLVLFVVCALSVEIFIKFNFFTIIDSIFKIYKKVINILPNKNISDHWKEKVIPVYALKIMKCSLQIFFILLSIISLFLLCDFFLIHFLNFSLSLVGVIESIAIVIGYIYLKRFIKDE